MIFLLFPFLISVNGLRALLTSAPKIPVGSEETAVCRFTFDESWDDYAKAALFRTDGFLLEVPLSEDNECDLPATLSAGKAPPFFLTVEGKKEGETIYTNSLCMQFKRTVTGGKRLKKYTGPTELHTNGIYPFENRFSESDLTVAVPTAADLAEDTVAKDALLAGYTAHDRDGERITGEIPTYDGPTVFSESAVIPTEGHYLATDLTVVLPPPVPAEELHLAFGDTPPENTSMLWMKTPKPEKVVLTGTLPEPVLPQFSKQSAVLCYPDDDGTTCLLACAAVGTDIYLFGGVNYMGWFEGREANRKIYRYDTLTDTMTDTGAVLPSPCCEMGCCVFDGKVYLFGGSSTANNYTIPGRTPSVAYDTILVYDPVLNTVTDTGARLPSPMAGLASVCVGDRIYCMAGYASDYSVVYREVFCYDPAQNTVQRMETLYPEEISGICAVPFDGKIYCFGGSKHLGGTFSDSVYAYDTAENEFALIGTLPTDLTRSHAFLCGDTVYLLGGTTDPDTAVHQVYTFSLKTKQCTRTNTEIPVYDAYGTPYETGHTSCMYSGASVGNTVYLFGGAEGTYFDCLNSVMAMTAGAALEPDIVTIGTDAAYNRFTLSETDSLCVETGVSAVLRGVGSGSAYPVDAFLYDLEAEEWVPIVSP